MLEYELEIAQNLLDDGYKVIFITCNGDRILCDANGGLNPPKKRICIECKSRVKSGVKWLTENDNVVIENYPNSSAVFDSKEILLYINKVKSFSSTDLFNQDAKFYVDGIEVLGSCISSSLTFFRVNNLSNIKKHIDNIKLQLFNIIPFVFFNRAIFEKYNPDIVYVFNGRLPIYNSLLQLSLIRNIKCNVYEYPIYGFERYIITQNKLFHDLVNYSLLLLNSYNNSPVPEEFKIKEGATWFDGRFKRNLDGFSADYISKQKLNFLPVQFEKNLFVISIFLTTENELNQVKELD